MKFLRISLFALSLLLPLTLSCGRHASLTIAAPISLPAQAVRSASPVGLQVAETLLAAHRDAEAEKAFRAALAKEPASAAAYQGLGLALLNLRDETNAFLALNHAVALQPDLPEAEFALAQLYYKAAFYGEARRRLGRLVRRFPDNPHYLHALGLCFGRDNQHNTQAELCLRAASALAPAQPAYLRDLASMEVKNHKERDAETHYRLALRLAPQDIASRLALGSFLAETVATADALKEAEDLERSCVAHAPNRADALYQLGSLLLKRGNAKASIVYLEGAVVRTPGLAQTWYLLACAYARLGNRKRADYCRTAFADVSTFSDRLSSAEEQAHLHQRDPALRLAVARLYAKGHDYARAINQYQICLYLTSEASSHTHAIAQQELDRLLSQLKSAGQLPNMATFNAMLRVSHPSP